MAPAEVTLHFTQAVEPAFSKVEVRDVSGAAVTDGPLHTQPGDAATLAIKLARLDAGVYTVTWHVTSIDAHKTQGKFHFTVTK